MGRPRIDKVSLLRFGKAVRLGHSQGDTPRIAPAGEHLGPVKAVHRSKRHPFARRTGMPGEKRHAAAAIAAHGRLGPVGIEVPHAEIRPALLFQKHEPVGTYSEPAVA
ncbi:unknown [Alistipes sp. CAG:157]|nr:unknown [Alistipes sp. CAG:157]